MRLVCDNNFTFPCFAEKSPLLAARTTATPISVSAGTTRNATSTEGRTDSLHEDHHQDPSDVDVNEKMISSDRAVVSFSQVTMDAIITISQFCGNVLSYFDSKLDHFLMTSAWVSKLEASNNETVSHIF